MEGVRRDAGEWRIGERNAALEKVHDPGRREKREGKKEGRK